MPFDQNFDISFELNATEQKGLVGIGLVKGDRPSRRLGLGENRIGTAIRRVIAVQPKDSGVVSGYHDPIPEPAVNTLLYRERTLGRCCRGVSECGVGRRQPLVAEVVHMIEVTDTRSRRRDMSIIAHRPQGLCFVSLCIRLTIVDDPITRL